MKTLLCVRAGRALVAPAAVVLVGLLAGADMAAAQTPVTVSIIPDRDNTLIEDVIGETSNGGEDGIFVGFTNASSIRRGLVRFDVASAVPAGSIITSVSLQMRVTMSISGAQQTSLHVLTKDWGEGTATGIRGGGTGGPAGPGDATWLHNHFNTSFWTTPGGDFVAMPSATIPVASGTVVWSTPAMIGDVQAWLDDPSDNFGWLVRGNEQITRTAKRFASREHTTAAWRPTLTITYIIPAPGTGLAVAAMGVLAMRRRR